MKFFQIPDSARYLESELRELSPERMDSRVKLSVRNLEFPDIQGFLGILEPVNLSHYIWQP